MITKIDITVLILVAGSARSLPVAHINEAVTINAMNGHYGREKKKLEDVLYLKACGSTCHRPLLSHVITKVV